MSSMLVDCFTLNNELDLLHYRLDLLKDVVDATVIVESTYTFSGKPKELHFNKIKNYFLDRYNIQHVIADSPPNDGNAWHNEQYQRNQIGVGVERLNLHPSDLLVISDLDELPDPNTLQIAKLNGLNGMYALEQDLYYYDWRCKALGKWHKAKLLDVLRFYELDGKAEVVRHASAPHMPRGGWHTSYFGDAEFIKQKLESFSHQEFNLNKFKDPQWIEECIKNQKDLFNRGDGFRHIDPKHNSYLPPNWVNLCNR